MLCYDLIEHHLCLVRLSWEEILSQPNALALLISLQFHCNAFPPPQFILERLCSTSIHLCSGPSQYGCFGGFLFKKYLRQILKVDLSCLYFFWFLTLWCLKLKFISNTFWTKIPKCSLSGPVLLTSFACSLFCTLWKERPHCSKEKMEQYGKIYSRINFNESILRKIDGK